MYTERFIQDQMAHEWLNRPRDPNERAGTGNKRLPEWADKALLQAYIDSWDNPKNYELYGGRFKLRGRSTNFIAKKWMSPSVWQKNMEIAAPEYNSFDPKVVGDILRKYRVQVLAARTGSPTIYVKGTRETLKKLARALRAKSEASEVGVVTGEDRRVSPLVKPGMLRAYWS